MNRTPRLVAAAMLLLTFVVGGLAGMVLEEGLNLDWFDFLDEDERPAAACLLTGLNLSATQQDEIEQILDDQDGRLEQYWKSRIPEMRLIVAASYERIRLVLTPGQREAFDERIRAQGLPFPRRPD